MLFFTKKFSWMVDLPANCGVPEYLRIQIKLCAKRPVKHLTKMYTISSILSTSSFAPSTVSYRSTLKKRHSTGLILLQGVQGPSIFRPEFVLSCDAEKTLSKNKMVVDDDDVLTTTFISLLTRIY